MPGYTDADTIRAFDLSEDRGALTEIVVCGCCSGTIILDQPEEDPAPRNCANCMAWLDAKSLERKWDRKREGRE